MSTPLLRSADDIPDLSGQVALVTGANSGLGLVTARELARHGAQVVMACRDTAKGEAARTALLADTGAPAERVEVRALDLASLESVRGFAAGWQGPLDVLVLNAGVMAPPEAAPDRRRLRAAVGHQPPGPLRPGRAALAGAGGARGPAAVARAGGDGVERRPQDGPDRLRRPQPRAVVQGVAGVRAVEAGQPALRPRARPPRDRRRRPGGVGGGAPRLRLDQPAVRRAGHGRPGLHEAGDERGQPRDRAVGRAGRAAAAGRGRPWTRCPAGRTSGRAGSWSRAACPSSSIRARPPATRSTRAGCGRSPSGSPACTGCPTARPR